METYIHLSSITVSQYFFEPPMFGTEVCACEDGVKIFLDLKHYVEDLSPKEIFLAYIHLIF